MKNKPQHVHRERPQPAARAKLGALERKKDYKARAKDYQEKSKALKALRKAAQERNPDEFHHHMVNSRTADDGTHREKTPESDDETALQKKLGEVKDLAYVRHRLHAEQKKIEKLKARLHMADAAITGGATASSAPKHTVFVDNDKEARRFDPVVYLNTAPEILDRTYNRPRVDDLKTMDIHGASSKEDVKVADRERRVAYNELLKRMERERELRVVVAKLELKQNLAAAAKGELKPKRVKKGNAKTAAVYKFPIERKR